MFIFLLFVYSKLYFNQSTSQKYELIYHFYRVKLLNLVAVKFLAAVLDVSTLTP